MANSSTDSITNANSISDIRTDFKAITFSGYQKSQVRKELLNCIYSKKIENSCYWACEFICAGHYAELWDIIIYYVSKYIHVGNPKLPIYIHMRFELFFKIMQNGYSTNILSMRNNDKIRKLFCECICVLCFSRKKHSIETIKIKTKEEFDLTNLAIKLKAPTTDYANAVLKHEDPKQLFIPINEFAYCLNQKNNTESCYWLEWILEYETICKKKKVTILAERRSYPPLAHQKDIIWIIWDILIMYSKSRKNQLMDKILDAILQLFMIKYTESMKRKRKHLIYYAITLLLEPIDWSIEIIEEKDEIDAIILKVNAIYIQLKKNEVAPKTDYLFNGLEKSNLDKTIEKLEMMDKL